jgi:hypothetical protein
MRTKHASPLSFVTLCSIAVAGGFIVCPLPIEAAQNADAPIRGNSESLWDHLRTASDLGDRRGLSAEWKGEADRRTLWLDVNQQSRYAWVSIPAPAQGWNLARIAHVQTAITNRGSTAADVMLWVVGDCGWDAIGDFASLAAGETRVFSCRLRSTFPDGTPKLDPMRVERVQVMLAKAAVGTSLEVRQLTAVGAEAEWIRPFGRIEVPLVEDGPPAPGRRVRYWLSGDTRPGVYTVLHLPVDWKPEELYPVIVEYPGNIFFSPACYSTGRPEQCVIGYGISKGRGAIWVSLPFIDPSAGAVAEDGWGDADATADYAVRAVEEILARFGGDQRHLLLTGFSRGAIACGFIGLRNDRIAKLWRGFHACQHYDGDGWGGATMHTALERARRVSGLAVFHTDNPPEKFQQLMLEMKAETTYARSGLGFHSCAMFLDDRPSTQRLRKWAEELFSTRQP